jgi:arginyl-tRNA synthetase
LRKAHAEGIEMPEKLDGVLDLLALDEEMSLIRAMSDFPALIEDIAEKLEPHRLTYYLTGLAASFHRYFNLGNKMPDKRVITSDLDLSRARLFLVRAIKIILSNGLGLLGIDAPEKM